MAGNTLNSFLVLFSFLLGALLYFGIVGQLGKAKPALREQEPMIVVDPIEILPDTE